MRWLKVLLAVNGALFVLSGVSTIALPTAWFLPAAAPGYAMDLARVVGVFHLGLGLIQLGTWLVMDRLAVRLVAFASLVVEAGIGAQAALQGAGSTATFHRLGVAQAVVGVAFAVLYALLLNRERAAAMA